MQISKCQAWQYIYYQHLALKQVCPTCFGKEPEPLLCAVSRAACVKITISFILKSLNYSIVFVVHMCFT
jgi:hypothetical protein